MQDAANNTASSQSEAGSAGSSPVGKAGGGLAE